MPLDAEYPVPGSGAFDGFDDRVLRRAGDDAQAIRRRGDRLNDGWS